ncbi:MAG: ABC transporter transmembrane domain-containing protein, partial [Planctomyces sp.]
MTDDALNPADADPAKRIVSSSGSLFIPAEDRTVWIVESGAVAIFYTATENQQPCGQRRFLFNCRSGEIIIGGMVGDRDSGGCLIAVAFQDSILRSVVLRPPAAGENSPLSPSPPSPSLAINDATLSRAAGFDCAVAVNALESWIGKLTQQILEDAPSVFVPRTAVGDVQSFDSGQAFGFVGHNVSWVGIENGTMAFCGQDELLLTKESGTVAMGHEGWLKALQPAEVSVRQTSELANANELLDGISALAALCLKQVRTRIIRENQTESQRLQRQQQLERMDTSEALRSVGSVLQSATASVIGDTEIERVLSVIGGTLGVKFCGPADSDESHRSGLTVDAICRASRVPTRNVQLRQRWWKEDHGCLLAYRIDNRRPVALIPQHNGTYKLHAADGSPAEAVDQAVAATLSDDAVMFYRPFPDQMADLGSLYRFTLSPLRRDIIAVILIAVAGALLGMLVPQATLMLIDDAIPDGNRSLVIQLALGLLAVTCGQAAFLFSQGIVTLRLQTLSAGPAQSAMWDRLLRLPMRFHRRYSSGDMMNRCLIVSEISEKVSGTILRTMLSGGMSLLTLGLLFFYDARLALIAVLIVAVLAVVVTVLSRAIQVRALALELSSSQIFGYVMQLLYGITKIRVSGGEQQAYNQWARRYAAQLRLTNIVQQLEDWSDTFTHSLPLCSSLILFGFATSFVTQSDDASSSSMSLGTFLAFMTAFGSLLEGGIELSDSVVEVMDSIGKSKLALPILTAPVEVTESRSDPGRLEG